MTSLDTGEAIEVSANAAPQHLMSLVRDALLAGTAWLTGQGYIDAITGTQIVGVGLTIFTIAWRQYVVHRNHQKLVAAAHAAPDSVARVR